MKFISIITLFLSLNSMAQNKNSSPLFFQADKNNVEVLPQRFEYALLDEDRLSIGDVLMDSTQVTFNLEPAKNGYNIRFTWPAGLLKTGQLTIKNNSGKAIFSAELKKNNVQISRGQPWGPNNLHSDIAAFTATDVDPELIETMKYLPFMVFCVYRQAEGTRLYMCSKELYLASQAGSIAVKPRNIHKATAMVEINNLPVGTQGIIYLNDRSEAVNFRSRTQSGSVLEIETRRNDVDFKDVVEDGSNLLLTASGAEPEDERGVKKISASDWQVLLPKDRPIVYLKGDGDIPMRQEFNIKGPLPQEKFRPYVGKNSVTKTYASNLNLQVNPPKEARLKEDVTDKSGRLESAANGTYRWALTNLPTGEDRRYLKVDAGNQTFTARFDTQRGAPFALALGAHYQTPSGLMFGSLEFQWWFENFLLINSPWSHLHWGFRLEQFQHLNTSSDYAKVDTTTAELLWRAQEGFNMIDASWGLSLPLQMLKSDSHSVTLFGGGIFWQMQPRSLSTFMNWFELKWQYFPISSGSDFKVKSAFDINANAFKKFSEKSNWYLRYGLGFSQYVYDPAAAIEDVQFNMNVGALWKF